LALSGAIFGKYGRITATKRYGSSFLLVLCWQNPPQSNCNLAIISDFS